MLGEPKAKTEQSGAGDSKRTEEFKRMLVDLLQNDAEIRDLLITLTDKEKRTKLFI